MKELKLNIEYTGADIVPEIVHRNTSLYGNAMTSFKILDLINDNLPPVDLIFSRDVLIHFSYTQIFDAIRNVKRSGAKYFLTTTYNTRKTNRDIKTGRWQPLNLQVAPFNFPEPVRCILEECTEAGGAWADKCQALWRIEDLPNFL